MDRAYLVHHFLEMSAARHPEKEAVFFQGRWATYGEIETRANRLAGYLYGVGVRKSERVTILMENSIDSVIALFAVLKTGAVAVPLHPDVPPDQLAFILQNAEPKVAISTAARLPGFLQALPERPSVSHLLLDVVPDGLAESLRGIVPASWTRISESGAAVFPRAQLVDMDLAEIVYTSGSTGWPKGVMLTHLNLVSNTSSIVDYLKIDDRDRVMAILPFSYIYGQSLLLTHMLTGGSVIIHNGFLFPNAVLKLMVELEATSFAGVPSTFSILLARSAWRQMKIPSLRYVTQAGGGMAPEVQAEVARSIAPAQLVVMYGATEASPRLSYLDPSDLPRKLGSIGKPIPNVDLFVADGSGQPLPPGREGEIVARGSNIMLGYWRDPDATKAVLRNGLYFTGDLGLTDEEGFLFVIGRTKEILKVKGFRVSPKELEDRLMEIPEIAEAAVIGVEDPVLGEAIKAFVVLKEPDATTEEVILNAFNSRMPVHKQIKALAIVEGLPKNSSGKILKNVLKGTGA
jgi:long-chain acyl-CoA synthetase